MRGQDSAPRQSGSVAGSSYSTSPFANAPAWLMSLTQAGIAASHEGLELHYD